MKIVDFLLEGRNNAIPLRDLVRIAGLDERTVRRQIHLERAAGAVIISDNRNGYYLPASTFDIQRFARSMSHRAGEIMKIAQAAECALAESEGQLMMEDWANEQEH